MTTLGAGSRRDQLGTNNYEFDQQKIAIGGRISRRSRLAVLIPKSAFGCVTIFATATLYAYSVYCRFRLFRIQQDQMIFYQRGLRTTRIVEPIHQALISYSYWVIYYGQAFLHLLGQ